MPWKVVKGLGCPADKPFAVVKHDADGKPVGSKLGCHKTRSDANKQLAALYANEGRQSDVETEQAITESLVIVRRRS